MRARESIRNRGNYIGLHMSTLIPYLTATRPVAAPWTCTDHWFLSVLDAAWGADPGGKRKKSCDIQPGDGTAGKSLSRASLGELAMMRRLFEELVEETRLEMEEQRKQWEDQAAAMEAAEVHEDEEGRADEEEGDLDHDKDRSEEKEEAAGEEEENADEEEDAEDGECRVESPYNMH